MGFFDGSKEMVAKRIEAVKNLCKEMNANYVYGAESLKEVFYLDYQDEMKDSNIITGQIEGYDYCIIEYYHMTHRKNDISRWISFGSLKMKNNYPDFEITTINSAKNTANIDIAIGSVLSCLILFYSIPCFFALFQGKTEAYLFFLISFIGILGIGYFAYYLLSSGSKMLKKIKNQESYNIKNQLFKNKYVILSDADPYIFKEIITDEVCSRIIEAKPEIKEIKVNKNCIKEKIGYDEKLSKTSCNKCIISLLNTARIFESNN